MFINTGIYCSFNWFCSILWHNWFIIEHLSSLNKFYSYKQCFSENLCMYIIIYFHVLDCWSTWDKFLGLELQGLKAFISNLWHILLNTLYREFTSSQITCELMKMTYWTIFSSLLVYWKNMYYFFICVLKILVKGSISSCWLHSYVFYSMNCLFRQLSPYEDIFLWLTDLSKMVFVNLFPEKYVVTFFQMYHLS